MNTSTEVLSLCDTEKNVYSRIFKGHDSPHNFIEKFYFVGKNIIEDFCGFVNVI